MIKSSVLTQIKHDVLQTTAVVGLMVKKNTDPLNQDYIHCPISLFASPFPKNLYEHAVEMQPQIGKLIAGIISDPKNNIHGLLDEFS